jgi:hypothetical protein
MGALDSAASDKVYQLLAHDWWFSPGTPASSTTKTGRHDIAESGVKHQNSNTKSIWIYGREHNNFAFGNCEIRIIILKTGSLICK